MKNRGLIRTLTTSTLILTLAAVTFGDDGNPLSASSFSGTFSDLTLSVTFAPSAAGYSGTITTGGNHFPASGSANGDKLIGTFNAFGRSFDFIATLAGDGMVLVSGGKSYTLVRAGSAAPATPVPITATPAPAKSGTLVMHKQTIADAVMDVDAYSILVPDGWQMQSSVSWADVKIQPTTAITVSNPALHAAWRRYPRGFYVDGIRENYIKDFPARRAEIEQTLAEGKTTQMGEIIHKMPATPKDFLSDIFIPANCPEIVTDRNARITAVTDMPDYAKALSDHDPLHRPTQTNRVRYTYTTADGPMECEFLCSMAVMTFPPAQGRFKMGPDVMYVTEVSTRTAPAGHLDAVMPTLNAIESSQTTQLPWYNLQVQVAQEFIKKQQAQWQQMLQNQRDTIAAQNQMLQDQRNSINQRQQEMHEAAQEQSKIVSDSIKQNFANQQAAKADCQERFMHYVNDTNKYRDPNDGSMVTLPSYKYQYEDNHGDVIGTDDPTFSPPIDPGTSWQPMDKIN